MSYRDPQSGDLSPFPGAPGGRGRPGGDLSPFPADPRTHASTSGQGAPPRGHAAPSLDAPHSGKTAPYFDVRAHGAENTLSPFQLPPLLNLVSLRPLLPQRRRGSKKFAELAQPCSRWAWGWLWWS